MEQPKVDPYKTIDLAEVYEGINPLYVNDSDREYTVWLVYIHHQQVFARGNEQKCEIYVSLKS